VKAVVIERRHPSVGCWLEIIVDVIG